MLVTARMIFLMLALVCFVISALGTTARVNLQSAGLALLVIAMLLV